MTNCQGGSAVNPDRARLVALRDDEDNLGTMRLDLCVLKIIPGE